MESGDRERPSIEIAVELVYGSEFWCNRHCQTNLVDLEGSRGPSLAEKRSKIDPSGTSRTPDSSLKSPKEQTPLAHPNSTSRRGPVGRQPPPARPPHHRATSTGQWPRLCRQTTWTTNKLSGTELGNLNLDFELGPFGAGVRPKSGPGTLTNGSG